MAKFKDDEVVVSWQTFAGEGIDEVIKRGTRLRGAHPAVRRWPQFFVADGTPEKEWPGLLDATIEHSQKVAAERAAENERKYPTIPADEVVVCIQGFRAGFTSVDEGARRRRTDPVVKKYPQFFGEPPRPLVAP